MWGRRASSAGSCLGSAGVKRCDDKPAALPDTAIRACAATEVLVGDFLNPFRRFAVWTKVRPSLSACSDVMLSGVNKRACVYHDCDAGRGGGRGGGRCRRCWMRCCRCWRRCSRGARARPRQQAVKFYMG